MQEYLNDALKIGMIDIETLDVHRTNSVITEVKNSTIIGWVEVTQPQTLE